MRPLPSLSFHRCRGCHRPCRAALCDTCRQWRGRQVEKACTLAVGCALVLLLGFFSLHGGW